MICFGIRLGFGLGLGPMAVWTAPIVPPVGGDALLLENGSYLLLETGDRMLL